MRETDKYYLFWKHQFGQWTLRDMTAPNGLTYNCGEQYMMHQKALLFSDQTVANEILETSDPAIQQQLGRKISGFVSSQWDQHKLGIVWYGNYLKFSQHEDLAQRLLATDDKILAEASPYDLIWGIGYAANDDRALDETQWRGQNLLGQVLMSVRALIGLV